MFRRDWGAANDATLQGFLYGGGPAGALFSPMANVGHFRELGWAVEYCAPGFGC